MPESWDRADAYEAYVGRRSRLVAPRFLAWAGVPAGGTVLDVGCGSGTLGQAALWRGAARLVGLARSTAYAAYAAAPLAERPPLSPATPRDSPLPIPDLIQRCRVSS